MKFSGKVGNGPNDQILVTIEITNADRDTGKTCLGGGMHCSMLLVSSSLIVYLILVCLPLAGE